MTKARLVFIATELEKARQSTSRDLRDAVRDARRGVVGSALGLVYDVRQAFYYGTSNLGWIFEKGAMEYALPEAVAARKEAQRLAFAAEEAAEAAADFARDNTPEALRSSALSHAFCMESIAKHAQVRVDKAIAAAQTASLEAMKARDAVGTGFERGGWA